MQNPSRLIQLLGTRRGWLLTVAVIGLAASLFRSQPADATGQDAALARSRLARDTIAESITHDGKPAVAGSANQSANQSARESARRPVGAAASAFGLPSPARELEAVKVAATTDASVSDDTMALGPSMLGTTPPAVVPAPTSPRLGAEALSTGLELARQAADQSAPVSSPLPSPAAPPTPPADRTPTEPASNAPAGARSFATGDIAYHLPAAWEVLPASGMRYATLKTPDGPEVSVIRLSGDGGGILMNVNRWRGQLLLPPLTQEQLATATRTIAASDLPITFVDIVSAEGRTIGAVVPAGDVTWFFKAQVKDAKTLDAVKPGFEAMLASATRNPANTGK